MENPTVTFTGQNSVELQDRPLAALKPNEIRIETLCTLISTGTESICLARRFEPGTHWDQWVKYPFFPGYSNVGRVVETGAEVASLKTGDKVFSRAGHSRYVVTPADSAVLVPEGVSSEAAAWGAIATIVQHGFRKASLQLGERVVVIGLGLLGQLMVQYAKTAGAEQVIAVDTATKRVRMAAQHGATHLLETGIGEARAEIKNITGGKGADVVFDMTGHPAVFAEALGLLRRLGKLVLVGDAGAPAEQRLTSDLLNGDLQVIGAHDVNPPSFESGYAPWTKRNMLRLFYQYLLDGRMRVQDMNTHSYAFTDAAEAYAMLLKDRSEAIGVILRFAE